MNNLYIFSAYSAFNIPINIKMYVLKFSANETILGIVIFLFF